MPARKRPRRLWSAAPGREPRPKIPDELKQRLQAEAEGLLEELRAAYIEPPPEPPRFNYRTGLHTEWFRSYLYLCSTYACPGPNALSPTFEVRFARLEYAGGDRFHLAYMRHTGQWWEVYRDLPLEHAMATIRNEVLFHP